MKIGKIDSKKLYRCMKNHSILGHKMPFSANKEIDTEDVLKWFVLGEPSVDNLDMKYEALGNFLVEHVFGKRLRQIKFKCTNYGWSGSP